MQKTYKKGKYYDNKLEKEIDFEYCVELTIQEKVDFINNVLQVLFQNDYYYSILKQNIFDFMLINFFTKIISDEEEFVMTLSNIDDFLHNTNVLDTLYNEIDTNLLKELYDTININIEYKTGIHEDEVSIAFSSLLNSIEEKVNEFDIKGLAKTLKKFGDVTDGMKPEKIMDLYTKTDTYKKNYKKTISSKNKQIRELKEKVNENK